MRHAPGIGEVISLTDYIRSRETVLPTGDGSGHVDLVCLAAYGCGEIDGADGEAILEHCRACPACGDHLAMILLLVEAKERRTARRRRAVAALAATVVFSVFLGATAMSGALRFPGNDTPPQSGLIAPAPAEENGGAAPAAATIGGNALAMAELGRRLATTEGPNQVDLDFIYPEQTLIPTGGIAPRDKRTELALIVDGSYAEAAELLTTHYGSEPADAEAAALLGMTLYLSGDDGDRGERLLRHGMTLEWEDLRNYSTWFLGNLYLRRGDILSAEELLKAIARSPDSPGTEAAELLERLGSEAR